MVLIITAIHQLERFGEKTFALNVGEKQLGLAHSTGCYKQFILIHSLCWAVELEGGGIFPRRVWIGRVSPS
jgi:hypothetical protein